MYLLLVSSVPIIFLKKFIYFWLRWVFVAARELSLVVASRGYSLLRCTGLSLWWPLLLRSTGSRRVGFSSWGARGLVALQHVGSSWTRARTRVPCIGRRILNHCTAREVPANTVKNSILKENFNTCSLLVIGKNCKDSHISSRAAWQGD